MSLDKKKTVSLSGWPGFILGQLRVVLSTCFRPGNYWKNKIKKKKIQKILKRGKKEREKRGEKKEKKRKTKKRRKKENKKKGKNKEVCVEI